MLSATRSSLFAGTPLRVTSPKSRSPRPRRFSARAKYGDPDQYFDLDDLEDTVGSWDLYGQQDDKRYPSLQNDFFERAGTTLSRKEAIRGLLILGAFGAFSLFGLKGSSDISLPIVKGPQKPPKKGPKGKL